MAIYVFSLLVGYEINGVDYAQGIRDSFLQKTGKNIKYIFTDVPQEKYIQIYKDRGIATADMLSAHLFLADNYELSGNSEVSKKIEQLKNDLNISRVVEGEESINLYRNKNRVASIVLKENKEFFSTINYYDNDKLIIREHYAGRLLYTDFFSTVKNGDIVLVKKIKTSFVNENGKNVFDCLYDVNGQEMYVFTNGMNYTKSGLIEKFIKKLKFSEKDIAFIDRPSYLEFVQPLFRYGSKAKIITFFHAGHFFEKGENVSALYLNYQYYYWFKYSCKINLMLVSTEEQKKELKEKLLEYKCYVPRIEAVPTSGLCKLRYPEKNRKKYSLLTVSRIDPRKRVDWVILSVIEARKVIDEISLDIYGTGADEYVSYLKKIVESNHAEHYIRFMGHQDVSDVYQNYEAYITASLWETLGLSVMEAIGSGNAVVGLNVRYGNRLLVENGKNGKLIDFVPEDSSNPEKIKLLTAKMADAIVEVLSDDEKLKAYHEHSYKIAERFLNDKIEKKWLELFETLETE